ncbi:phosphatase domain-containing protein [Algoriphagus sp. SE2]|uniref:App1 family protein n=1 Tax=Algoriphagus sp. SE2 TaxID=3141536 RepID=UPI0031CD4711
MNTESFIQNKARLKEKIKVEPFLSFGNKEKIFVKGRVITSYKQKRPKSSISWFKNILATIRRYSVKSIPEALVEIHFHGHRFEVRTDENGVFEKHIEVENPYLENPEFVNFKVLEPLGKNKSTLASKEVLRIESNSGIISDIDDTILISHSTDIGKKFWLSISKNAYTRRPLPGVSDFYNELTHQREVPIFYVSSSDWSLFDLIRDFMLFRNIPLGPTLLKDKHINLKNIWKSGGGNHDHKLEKILFLFELYPKMKFFLIGDSGQHDPEIYANVIKKYPDRVQAVFIRLIGQLGIKRKESIEQSVGMKKFFFVESSDQALEIARKNQFIKIRK